MELTKINARFQRGLVAGVALHLTVPLSIELRSCTTHLSNINKAKIVLNTRAQRCARGAVLRLVLLCGGNDYHLSCA